MRHCAWCGAHLTRWQRTWCGWCAWALAGPLPGTWHGPARGSRWHAPPTPRARRRR